MNPQDKPRIRKLDDFQWICEKTWVKPLLFATGYTPAHAFRNYVFSLEYFVPEPKPEPLAPYVLMKTEDEWRPMCQPSPWWKFW